MAIVSVREIWRGRSGNETLDLAVATLKRDYTRVFRVRSNILRENDVLVKNAPGIPAQFSPHPNDLAARVHKKSASQEEDGFSWKVTVEYTTDIEGPDAFPDGPLQKPLDFSWESERYDEALQRDVNEAPIVNTVGDTFDPPLETERSRLVLKVTKNVATFDPNVILLFQNTVNIATWYGSPAKTVRCDEVSATRTWYEKDDDAYFYWTVNFKFTFNPKTWVRRILNQGYRAKDPLSPGAEVRTILDENGKAIQQPALLDEFGFQLGIPPLNLTLADVHYVSFEEYEVRDFDLGLLHQSELPPVA